MNIKLKRNDLLLIVAPAGALKEEDLKYTLEFIKKNQWRYEIGEHVFDEFSFGYDYSGTISERLKDLQWALDHPQAKAIWFARGGYGGVHLVDSIKIDKFRKNPKILIGYSDNTVFHQYFNRLDFNTFHATVAKYPSEACSDATYDCLESLLKGNNVIYEIENHEYNNLDKYLRKGEIRGKLSGGNLAIIYSLLGSSTLDHFDDKFLFIEDVGEKFYSIDRMLMALKRAGIFDRIKGLIVGGMTNMENPKENPNYEMPYDSLVYKIINERLKEFDFPKIFAFPSGHIYDNRPLVFNGEIVVKKRENKIIIENKVI